MDVPAAKPDLSPVPEEDVGMLDVPTPTKDAEPNAAEQELLKLAAGLAAGVAEKKSGANNA